MLPFTPFITIINAFADSLGHMQDRDRDLRDVFQFIGAFESTTRIYNRENPVVNPSAFIPCFPCGLDRRHFFQLCGAEGNHNP
jgi:hypothetical protein